MAERPGSSREQRKDGTKQLNKTHIPTPGEERPVTRRQKLFNSRDLRSLTIGWEIALPLFSGPLVGYLIDRSRGTGYLWTLILLVLGVILAVMSVVRYVRYEQYLAEKDLKAKEKHGLRRRKN